MQGMDDMLLRGVLGTNQTTKGITEMRKFKSISAIAFGLLAFLIFALGTQAQAERPHYLHALSNLRQARALLQSDRRPEFGFERNHAIEEIDFAIKDVKAAARDEGKDAQFTPPPATEGDPYRPMRSAIALLDDARRDVAAGLDAPEDRDLQFRTLKHIDEAHHALDHAMHGMDRGPRY
jgi:hypothetical protein